MTRILTTVSPARPARITQSYNVARLRSLRHCRCQRSNKYNRVPESTGLRRRVRAVRPDRCARSDARASGRLLLSRGLVQSPTGRRRCLMTGECRVATYCAECMDSPEIRVASRLAHRHRHRSGLRASGTGEASTSVPAAAHSFRRCCSRRARRFAVSCRSATASSSWLPRAIGASGDTISRSVVPPTSRADLTAAPLGRARPAWPSRADPSVDLAVVRLPIRREEQGADDRWRATTRWAGVCTAVAASSVRRGTRSRAASARSRPPSSAITCSRTADTSAGSTRSANRASHSSCARCCACCACSSACSCRRLHSALAVASRRSRPTCTAALALPQSIA